MHCSILQHTATHNATHCNTLQHTATHISAHCNTLQHTDLEQNLEFARIQCCTLILIKRAEKFQNYVQFLPKIKKKNRSPFNFQIMMSRTLHSTHCNKLQDIEIYCNALQHTVTDCNTLQCTALHCNTLQLTASHYKKLKHTALHTATHCNTLQQTAIPVNVLSTKVPNNARIQVNVSDITMGTLQQSATHTATNCNTHCNTHYNTSGKRVMYKNPK